jgi:hypothetical protein
LADELLKAAIPAMYKGRRVFRPGSVIVLLVLGATVLFAAAAFAAYRHAGWNWVSIGLAAATGVFGFGGIVESLILRIELTDDAMLVTDLTGRRRYGIADIERIEEAKGGPPAILLKGGRWVKLPSAGSDLGNSVRAWLKQR